MGATSRGLFLLVPPQQIVFVSFEHYRSPLTINLDRRFDRLSAVETGAAVQFSDTRLIFPSIKAAIALPEDAVWHCPPPGIALRPRLEQRQTLRAIAVGILAQRGHVDPAALLPILLDWPDVHLHSAGQSALLDRLIALRRAVQVGDDSTLLAGLTRLLGQGRGLTPSGDDVTIGLLLMLNRWHSDQDWSTVNHGVIKAAYRATTIISANLIECAADGQGDERLITLVDGIAAGSAPIDECVECALNWGSSSGIDVLVGVIVALDVT
jgi:hypothetical protein